MSNHIDKEAAKILMLMAHRGFIWGPSPEIYEPVKGAYELGPLGKEMKNHLESYLRKRFRKTQFWEVQCPLISPERVWEASGHLGRFFDYTIQCTTKECQHLFRADTLIEQQGIVVHDLSIEGLTNLIESHNITCPDCQGALGEVKKQNLMVTSQLGLPPKEFILRPETATTTYLMFPRLHAYFRTKMPLRVFQMGYAFRNEISPRKMLLRTREFEQCEGQLFITPEDEMNFSDFTKIQDYKIKILSAKMQETEPWVPREITLKDAVEEGILAKPAYAWLLWLAYDTVRGLGNSPENIRMRQHRDDEKAHYALDAWDLEMHSKLYGWTEVCGVHDRGDYDLGRHFKYSKEKKLQVPGATKGSKVIPHTLEIAFGVGRLFFFTLEQAFTFETERNVLDLPIEITPVPFAVFPLQKKPKELSVVAKEIYEDLIENEIGALIDDAGSIGKRYRRTEEIGVRYAFTIDHVTLEDDTLTIRNIEDMSQKRIKKGDVTEIALNLLHKRISFTDIEDLTPPAP